MEVFLLDTFSIASVTVKIFLFLRLLLQNLEINFRRFYLILIIFEVNLNNFIKTLKKYEVFFLQQTFFD